MADRVKTRPYRSVLRAEQAQATRRAILTAARALFVRHGYAETSLADVAQQARVARPTVFAAFGSKAALLKAVLDVALAGDDDPVPVAERPWFRPVFQARSARALFDAYAAACMTISSRAADVYEVVRAASDSGGEVAKLWQELKDQRHTGAAMVVSRLNEVAKLRQGLTRQTATDVLWTLNDPALYWALVVERQWDPTTFQEWLSTTMRCQLAG